MHCIASSTAATPRDSAIDNSIDVHAKYGLSDSLQVGMNNLKNVVHFIANLCRTLLR